jgi:hypothetical protein
VRGYQGKEKVETARVPREMKQEEKPARGKVKQWIKKEKR